MTQSALLKNDAQVWGVELTFICKTGRKQTYQHTIVSFELVRNNGN